MVTFKCAVVCMNAPLTLCVMACPHNHRLGEQGRVECDESPLARDDTPDEAYQISFGDAPPAQTDPPKK